MKIIINNCYGGFGISIEAFEWLIKEKGWILTDYSDDKKGYKDPKGRIVNSTYSKYYFVRDERDLRTDLDLIECIETLGDKADGMCAKLNVIEIPDGIEYTIEEYDGFEHIAEKHRTWRD